MAAIVRSPFPRQTRPEGAADAALMARVVAGDEDAFRLLFEAYASRVKALALRTTRHHELADEVVQEVFMAVWERPRDYRSHRGSVCAWLMTITHHRSVDRVRRERTQAERAARLAAVDVGSRWAHDESAQVIERLDERERAMDVGRALDILPGSQREVIERMYFGGRSGTQVAADLGIPLGTVKSRTLLGMKKMRSTLGGGAMFEPAG